MSKAEYATWVDKLMAVRHIDTARTTSLPIMDAADALAVWENELTQEQRPSGRQGRGAPPRDAFDATADAAARARRVPPPLPIKKGDKIDIYWTDMNRWFTATFTSDRVAAGDDA